MYMRTTPRRGFGDTVPTLITDSSGASEILPSDTPGTPPTSSGIQPSWWTLGLVLLGLTVVGTVNWGGGKH
jgi:hypothetical protein